MVCRRKPGRSVIHIWDLFTPGHSKYTSYMVQARETMHLPGLCFREKIISRYSNVNLPSRFAHLTTSDFFLWLIANDGHTIANDRYVYTWDRTQKLCGYNTIFIPRSYTLTWHRFFCFFQLLDFVRNSDSLIREKMYVHTFNLNQNYEIDDLWVMKITFHQISRICTIMKKTAYHCIYEINYVFDTIILFYS